MAQADRHDTVPRNVVMSNIHNSVADAVLEDFPRLNEAELIELSQAQSGKQVPVAIVCFTLGVIRMLRRLDGAS